jgi:hypothetical protein
MLASTASLAAERSLEDLIKQMAREGISVKQEFVASVRERVRRESGTAFELASQRLAPADTPDEERAVLVWVLALTGRPEAVGIIIGQARTDASAMLRANIDNALAELGGDEAGAFLFRELKAAKTEQYKLHLIGLLAKIKYEPALTESFRVLKMDPLNSNDRQIHVFGMMGDMAVPYLIEQLASPLQNARRNSVTLLGQWLMAPAATGPLMKRYFDEPDRQIQKLILDALERTESDLKDLRKFAKKVAGKEKDAVLKRTAKEIIENIPRMRKAIRERHKQRGLDPEKFQKAYGEIFASRGLIGSYTALGISSSYADEPALKLLRERILSRDDEKSLFHAQDINRIILINRLIRSEGLD